MKNENGDLRFISNGKWGFAGSNIRSTSKQKISPLSYEESKGTSILQRNRSIYGMSHLSDSIKGRDRFIIRIMKSRRLRWAGHVARMGEKRQRERDN
jgi:hypothetical protein